MSTRNRPTPEGREIGAWLANLTDEAEPKARLGTPDLPPRCQSCAFRGGTFPNGCPVTVIDALHSVGDARPFFCHQHFDEQGEATHICSGWIMAMHSQLLRAMGEMAIEAEPKWLDREIP